MLLYRRWISRSKARCHQMAKSLRIGWDTDLRAGTTLHSTIFTTFTIKISHVHNYCGTLLLYFQVVSDRIDTAAKRAMDVH